MKTKILLIVLSALLFCPFNTLANENAPNVLTDDFLKKAFRAASFTTGQIELMAKYQATSQKKQKPFETKKQTSASNYREGEYDYRSSYSKNDDAQGNQPQESADNRNALNKLQQLKNKAYSSDGNTQSQKSDSTKENRGYKDWKKKYDEEQELKRKKSKHYYLWPFYAIGSDILLSIVSPTSRYRSYFTDYNLDRYDLSFHVTIASVRYTIKIVALHNNLALWKIQEKLKTKLLPLNISLGTAEMGEIVTITTFDKYGQQKRISAGNISGKDKDKNSNKIWIDVWNGRSLSDTYIAKNLKGQVVGVSGGKDNNGYSHTIRLSQEQIKSLKLSTKRLSKIIKGIVIGFISLRPLTHDIAERLDAEREAVNYIGKRIMLRRYPSRTLENMGFRKGDVIKSINGVSVSSIPEIKKELNKVKKGSIVSIVVVGIGYERRAGNEVTIRVKARKKTLFDYFAGTI